MAPMASFDAKLNTDVTNGSIQRQFKFWWHQWLQKELGVTKINWVSLKINLALTELIWYQKKIKLAPTEPIRRREKLN